MSKPRSEPTIIRAEMRRIAAAYTWSASRNHGCSRASAAVHRCAGPSRVMRPTISRNDGSTSCQPMKAHGELSREASFARRRQTWLDVGCLARHAPAGSRCRARRLSYRIYFSRTYGTDVAPATGTLTESRNRRRPRYTLHA